jgi:hypothetical protein
MSWLFGDSLSGNNYEDPLGQAGSHFQRYTDPLALIFGQKYIDLTSKTLPTAGNRALSSIVTPIDKASSYIDPLYSQTAGIHNWVNHKPGSTFGAVMGGMFAAPAIGGAAGASGGAGAGTAGAADAGAIGAADAGTAGASGLTGLFSGPAAYGDAGMTGAVSSGGSGLGAATAGDMGGALGSSPTGLFSGLLPGGGMSGTSSGALGGGLSGEVAGAAPIGGASMGGFNFGSLANMGQNLMNQGARQQPQQQGAGYGGRPLAFGNPHVSTGVVSPATPYTQFNGASYQPSPLQTAALMQAGAKPFGGFYG